MMMSLEEQMATDLHEQLKKLGHDVKAMPTAMPSVDVKALRRQYRAEHAAEIAAHEKHIADMRTICRIFEKNGTALPAKSSASAAPRPDFRNT